MKTLNEYETIDKLKEGYSISRYGDGEISFIVKSKGIHLMQNFNERLRDKLLFILNSPLDNLLIGIPRNSEEIQNLKPRPWIPILLERLGKIVPADRIFASSFISRPCVVGNNNIEYYDYIRSIWKGKDVVLVNFEDDIVNHYLYRDCNIEYIKIQRRNCFEQYGIILNKCRWFYGQNRIFLSSAGPTATCLSYDIAKDGEQCIDIGHLAYEYAQFIGENKPRRWVSQG